MRIVNEHKLDADDPVAVFALGYPERGAYHHYAVARVTPFGFDDVTLSNVLFQNGPIGEHGINGVTHEALLAIVLDRLRMFQTGPHKCHENAKAIERIEEGLHWLHARTLRRKREGTEGTSAV